MDAVADFIDDLQASGRYTFTPVDVQARLTKSDP